MLREVVFIYVWALCLSTGHSQPVSCTDAEHCAPGYYCDEEARSCKQCLRCQDFKREQQPTDNSCVKSIDKCGTCFEGYVIDRMGDVTAPCVLMSDAAEPGGTPNYVWWIIGVLGIVFLGLTIGIMLYIYLNPGVFRFAGNCPSSMVSTNIMTAHRPSAPDVPPPYSAGEFNIPYSSVRNTDSPCPLIYEAGDMGDSPREDGPFIKRTSGLRPASGPRESASNQATKVFKRPVYERQEPSSPELPLTPEINDNFHDHDERTMPSFWTAEEPSNEDEDVNVNGGSASEPAGGAGDANVAESSSAGLSALLATARHTTLVEPSPAKRARTASQSSNSSDQDRNQHSHRDNNPGAANGQGNFSGTHNGTPYLIINNVVQVNQNS